MPETQVYNTIPTQIEEIEQYSFLFYGGSGSGKTSLAAQFIEIGQTLFLSCDTGKYGGLLSGRRYSPLQIRLNTYDDYLKCIEHLEKDAGERFRVCILDSVTSFQRIVMQHILRLSGREVARFEDWSLCVERVRTALNKLGGLRCHLILTATEQLIRDELIGKLIGLPNLPGKLAHELPAAVDVVLHLYTRTGYDKTGKKQVNYLMSSTPDELWVAKDRTALLPVEAATDFKTLKILFEGKEVIK